ncbi:hypothetical protein V6Z11_A03G137100 [Gossypium hirsutum]
MTTQKGGIKRAHIPFREENTRVLLSIGSGRGSSTKRCRFCVESILPIRCRFMHLFKPPFFEKKISTSAKFLKNLEALLFFSAGVLSPATGDRRSPSPVAGGTKMAPIRPLLLPSFQI